MNHFVKYDKKADLRAFNEGKFDNIDLGGGKINDKILQFRKQLAQNLEDLIADEEFNVDMTLGQVIEILRK